MLFLLKWLAGLTHIDKELKPICRKQGASGPRAFVLGPRVSRPHRAPSGAKGFQTLALCARGGRDARGPSEELDGFSEELDRLKLTRG